MHEDQSSDAQRSTRGPDPEHSPWPYAWAELSRAAGIAPGERLVLALSGGADSVFLLHLLSRARPEHPEFTAVHVQHGLRGVEGLEDAEFCRELCARLAVPFRSSELRLDRSGPSLEARARTLRYRALAGIARELGAATILTGHHADDALETLLMRLLRGTEAPGLAGPRLSTELGPDLDPGLCAPGAGVARLRVVRPLLGLRREEVRSLLREQELSWRDDSSNLDRRHTRNQVRLDLIPLIEQLGGAPLLDELRGFARAIERFEDELAGSTAHLAWKPCAHAAARPVKSAGRLGGRIERKHLMPLPLPLLRRALWRLLRQGSGLAPTREQLDVLCDSLKRGRCARLNLRGDWRVWLRSRELQLVPPARLLAPLEPARPAAAAQACLPYVDERGQRYQAPPELDLSVPGDVQLPDGRRIRARLESCATSASPLPNGRLEVALDAEGLTQGLYVRWPLRGDRFHGLGAPGRKSLARFLTAAGVPREERPRVPLVCRAGEILWVVGLRPCQRHRVRRSSGARLYLELVSE